MPDQKTSLREALVLAAQVLPSGIKVNAQVVNAYARLLADVDADAAANAVMLHIQTQKFFPTVADIREAVCGTKDDEIIRVWAMLDRCSAGGSTAGLPGWAVEWVNAQGGIRALGSRTVESFKRLEPHFRQFAKGRLSRVAPVAPVGPTLKAVPNPNPSVPAVE